MPPIIEIIKVNKSFDKQVLVDINFSLFEGQTLGLIGKNGAGKTTLIKIILGFFNPSGGMVRVFGQEPRKATGTIGYLPEHPNYHLLFSGIDYLKYLGRISKVGDLNKRVRYVLDLVGMTGNASRRMNRYSKGMLQRIGLAQAILLNPSLLILDEPLSGLDPSGQKDLRDVILEQQNQGKSILLCSHLLNEVEKVCSNIAIIHQGKFISQGGIDNILVHENRFELKISGLSHETLRHIQKEFKIIETGEGSYIFDEHNSGDKEIILKKIIELGGSINELKHFKKSLEEYFILCTRGH